MVQSDVFGSRYILCPGERFWNQPCMGIGTGVLVANDLIATAGHCVSSVDREVTKIRFIFGFRAGGDQRAPTTFPVGQVYSGKELLGYAETPDDTDWAIVRLDRPVENVPTAPVRRSGALEQGTPVSIVGHPCGLPAKYATGAVVKDNTPTSYFKANLDAFGGNSGSPVFSRGEDGTCLVEGLLVRGNQDWVYLHDKNCRSAFVIPLVAGKESDLMGEDCTRVSEFLSLIPA
jgi:V8-like Glu-specific endopeptidase